MPVPDLADDTPRATTPPEDALLVGRVVDGDGDGVAGADVYAVTGFSWVRAPLAMEQQGLDRRWFQRAEVTTDPDGHFAFLDTLKKGDLRLEVRASGFAPRSLENLQLSDRRPQQLTEITLEAGVTLEGRVVDRLGKAVPDAAILQAIERGVGGMRVTIPGRGVLLTTSDAQGRFVVDALADGPWRFIVDASGYQVREERGRTEAKGAVHEGLLFVLERGERIQGVIKDLPAELASELRVEARPKGAGRGSRNIVATEASEASVPRARRAAVEGSGRFVIEGLAPGVSQVLTVWRHDTGSGWTRFSAVASSEAWPGTAGLELLFRPESALLLAVVDAVTRRPIEDFVVWAGLDDRLRSLKQESDDEQVHRHHPGGRVRFGQLRPGRDGAKVGVRIRAVAYQEHERKRVPLEPGQELDLGVIALEPAAVVRVTALDDASGEPVQGARVFLAPEGVDLGASYLSNDETEAWDHDGLRFGRTGAEGVAILSAVVGEMCTLVATSEEHVASDPVDVFVRAGTDVERTLRLPRGGTVVVTVRSGEGQPIAAAKVEHRYLDDPAPAGNDFNFYQPGEVPATALDGTLRFEHLPSGLHGFKLRSEADGPYWQRPSGTLDSDWKQVRVVEGAEQLLTLVGESRGRLKGIVSEARLPLAGASLRLQPRDQSRRARGWGWNPGGDKYGALSEYDGRFVFEGIECGDYLLTVDHPERRMTHTSEVTISAGENSRDVELTLAIIEGRVSDPQGRPLPGLDVGVSAPGQRGRNYRGMGGTLTLVEDARGTLSPDWRADGRRRARTNADGEYALRGVATSQPLTVAASGRFVIPDRVDGLEVAPDEIRRGVDFVLKRAGDLRVALTGNVSRNLRIEARLEEKGKTLQRRNARLRGSRPADLRACLPGTWLVQVKRPGGAGVQVVAEAEAEVRIGERTTVTIQVP